MSDSLSLVCLSSGESVFLSDFLVAWYPDSVSGVWVASDSTSVAAWEPQSQC